MILALYLLVMFYRLFFSVCILFTQILLYCESVSNTISGLTSLNVIFPKVISIVIINIKKILLTITFLSIFSLAINDIINSIIVTPIFILLTPILGISTNPIKNVPTILPIVDNDDILPDNEPISCSSILFIFTAYGEIIANIKLGIENTIIAHIIAAIIKLGIKPANIFTTQVSNNGIALVANAEYNKISKAHTY